jgi:hypothetical protein
MKSAAETKGGMGSDATCFHPEDDERLWTSDVVIEAGSEWKGSHDGARALAGERLK